MYSLETRKLCKSFGALTVADNIDGSSRERATR